MRTSLVAAVAAGALLLSATPAAATPSAPSRTGTIAADIVEVVLAVSGDSGFDRRSRDFDLLREALVATDLVGAVAAAEDVTVFAPNDRAFRRLASQLGWDGRDGEAGAFDFLVAEVGAETIADVLTYHVGLERLRLRDLFGTTDVATLLGPEVTVRRFRVVDADTDDRDPAVTFPWYVPASNGSIVVIDDVLRPIDLA